VISGSESARVPSRSKTMRSISEGLIFIGITIKIREKGEKGKG
jgi:hypothetical protein